MAIADIQDVSDFNPRNPIDQDLVRAIAHPLRVGILELMHHRLLSPKLLAQALRVPLGNISYHVGVLEKSGAVHQVKTEPRRGATEHFFAITPRSMVGHQDWRRAPLGIRPGVTNEAVRSFFERIRDAFDAGMIDRRADTTLNWMPVVLDERGWLEVQKLLKATGRLLEEAHRRSRERLGDADGIAVVTGLAAFEAPPRLAGGES